MSQAIIAGVGKTVGTSEIEDGAVTTQKITDDAVTLAKMEHGTQGDILFYGAGGEPARLPAGTSGYVLATQGAGANPVWQSPATPGAHASSHQTGGTDKVYLSQQEYSATDATLGQATTVVDGAITTSKITDGAITTVKLADDAVTLAKMEHGTQGDILYYGANGEPTRLPAGTSGQFLKTLGAGANPVWANVPAAQGIIADITTTSNVDYVDITGLDINTDKYYILCGTIRCPLSGETFYYLYVNGDYTVTNYYSQVLTAYGTTVAAGRRNDPLVAYASPSVGRNDSFYIPIIRDPAGIPRWSFLQPRYEGGAVEISMIGGVKTAAVTNITSLRIAASAGGGIGAGSRFILSKPI